MHNFKELHVWQKARELNKNIYLLSKRFPDHEKYAITSQIHRASTSIASNIAEGSGRGGDKEFIQFLHIAYGSSFELETQITLANDLGYIIQQTFDSISMDIQEIEKMLYGLINRTKRFIKPKV